MNSYKGEIERQFERHKDRNWESLEAAKREISKGRHDRQFSLQH